ncbi:MAG: hypothetical protein R3F59_12370 [Myxococcota bacterium]
MGMDARCWALAVAATLVACKGGGGDDGDGEGSQAPPIVLTTTSGVYDIRADIVEDDCGRDVRDSLDELELKLSQVATGLSVFVDADVGWVPCTGSVQQFDCQWGNAPGNTPAGSWDWRFWGTSDGDTVDASLSLTVTCDVGARDCDECQIVADITGTLEN